MTELCLLSWQRHYAKIGLALREAAASLEDEQSGPGQDFYDLEEQAVQYLASCKEEMTLLYGEDHWACRRIGNQLQAALENVIAVRSRKKARVENSALRSTRQEEPDSVATLSGH
mmetsp:Transcript_44659/g.69878  ORF Transcript_44659/g.69878 Transcript_44659/m.69878 type:complete len:115 (+) Transcript_44659:1698-2042(+)